MKEWQEVFGRNWQCLGLVGLVIGQADGGSGRGSPGLVIVKMMKTQEGDLQDWSFIGQDDGRSGGGSSELVIGQDDDVTGRGSPGLAVSQGRSR